MSSSPPLNPLLEKAKAILRTNDRGNYTVPASDLYPFQWNWDSCLTALGQTYVDEQRAWLEIQTLFSHQWQDGMVPHIIFHEHDEGYFPGPDIWGTQSKVTNSSLTSGITQPPVAAFAARKLFEGAADIALARESASSLIGKIHAWHEWFYTARDPRGTGLVALLHPWESGRDNSIDWDDAFNRVPTDGITPYTRRDTQHADPAHRPTREQYDRFLWLVEHFRDLQWDNLALHDASPFQLVDPGFNAILIRSCKDLAWLAEQLGDDTLAKANHRLADKALVALDSLWSDSHGQYVCYDRAAGRHVNNASVGGLLPVLTTLPAHRLTALTSQLEAIGSRCNYLVPSQDPQHAQFDAKRYWRGPAWLIVNYLLADGFRQSGKGQQADAIDKASLSLIEQSGFAEYYDPLTAEPLGGSSFTWTAAMVIRILQEQASR